MKITEIKMAMAGKILLAIVIISVAGCGRNSGKETTGPTATESRSVSKEKQDGNRADEPTLAGNAEYRVSDRGMIVPVNRRPAIVDFGAEWCPPCRKLKPIFSKLSREYAGRIDFISVDVDANEEIARNYVGRGIPTLVFLLPDGNVAGSKEGFMSEEELRGHLDNLLKVSSAKGASAS